MKDSMNQFDYIFLRFAKAAGINPEKATERENSLLCRLVGMAEGFSYDATLSPSYIEKKLREARKTGKSIRIVPDREFWVNSSCHDQCDGWRYHIELYSPRKRPTYLDSKGNEFTKDIVSFHKEIKGGKIWSVNTDEKGPVYVTFDKKTIYNLFGDYPDNMTPEQLAIVKEEMPYWAEFFAVNSGLLFPSTER